MSDPAQASDELTALVCELGRICIEKDSELDSDRVDALIQEWWDVVNQIADLGQEMMR